MDSTLKITAFTALLAMAGCSSTPMQGTFGNHFASAKGDPATGKCFSEHAMFNNRQLMVAPSAVESAWSYCMKQSEPWYRGRGEARTTSVLFEGR